MVTKSEHKQITKWVSTLSNEQLEKEYYCAVYDTLGSESEIMEEQGWDNVDIKERRKFEKYLGDKADILEKECSNRGIKLWESKT